LKSAGRIFPVTNMTKAGLLLVLLLGRLSAAGQDDTLTLDDDLLRSAEQWAKENLDEDALRVLQSADQDKVRQFLAQIQKQFHGEYVVDLASLKDTAKNIVPLLQSYDETLPYAIWLNTRLDYLDVADQFKLIIPLPKAEPGQPPKPWPNPAPQKEREVWVRELAERPWPKNAKPYIANLKPIFATEKVPPELVWIAEVESSFDPRARSPIGATGLFQLMPNTAQRYGLRTWPLDQRLKPETSGRAAAQYLRHLHGHFKDWRLALAAYNAGEGTVQALLERRKATSFDSIADRLPAETQLFVPKVEATLYRREGLKLSQLHLPSPSRQTP
jgi:membrane-bound lytic murein transglycosylase D